MLSYGFKEDNSLYVFDGDHYAYKEFTVKDSLLLFQKMGREIERCIIIEDNDLLISKINHDNYQYEFTFYDIDKKEYQFWPEMTANFNEAYSSFTLEGRFSSDKDHAVFYCYWQPLVYVIEKKSRKIIAFNQPYEIKKPEIQHIGKMVRPLNQSLVNIDANVYKDHLFILSNVAGGIVPKDHRVIDIYNIKSNEWVNSIVIPSHELISPEDFFIWDDINYDHVIFKLDYTQAIIEKL